MTKYLSIFFLFFSLNLYAEGHDQIAPLSEALENASEDQLLDMEIADTSLIDVGGEVEAENLIEEGFIQGDFTPEDLISMDEAAEILEANLEFFDFDIVELIGDALESGDVTEEEVAYTLMIFSTLSAADRTVVGQEEFTGDTTDASWSDISAEGQAIICNAGLATGGGC